MSSTVCLDTNIIARYLLNDQPELANKAEKIIHRAKDGIFDLYIDEVVLAELVWLFASYYKKDRSQIGQVLQSFVSQPEVVNPRKDLILEALTMFSSSNLSYVDCWLATVAKEEAYALETFDRQLAKHSNTKRPAPSGPGKR